MDNVDHDKRIMLIAAGGPPCPNFPTMRAQPTGTSGETGHLFQDAVHILDKIKQALCPVPLHINVVPHPDVKQDIDNLSAQLHMNPIIVEGGIIHRRRLWWLSVYQWTGNTYSVCSPPTPWACQWMQTDQPWPRLHNPIASTLQPQLQTTALRSYSHTEQRSFPLPHHTCARPQWTPAPAKCNERPDTMAR